MEKKLNLKGKRLKYYLLLLSLFFGSFIFSQKISIKADKISYEEIFQKIEQQSPYKFYYQAENINVKKTISVNFIDESIQNVLTKIFEGQDIEFQIKEDKIILSKQLKQPETEKKVTGVVLDEKNNPIPGVSISIKGTQKGVISDFEGKFEFIAQEDAKLTFSFIGYQTLETIAKGEMRVSLNPESVDLNEVVVVGYGSQRKKDLTGSIVSVSVDKLNTSSSTDLGAALQGKAAGVQVISSGQPGSNVTFRIRGSGTINSNDPLIVVDGIPLSTGLNQLNMEDIESIQILKDASATAIYGSRGANGVVIATTKRGKGLKPALNFSYSHGIQQATNVIEMLNASQFAQLHNEMMTNAGKTVYSGYANPESLGSGTDWLDEILRVAPVDNYSLSYAQNSGNTNFYVSGNIFEQKGILINTDFTRYVLQFNSDTKLFKIIKFGNSLKIEYDKKNNGDNAYIRDAMLSLPTQPVRRANGKYSGPIAAAIYDGDITNPVGRSNSINNTTKGYNLHGSIYGELNPIEGLTLKTTYGLEANFWDDRTWSPKFAWDTKQQSNSYLYQRSNKSITWLWDNIATYDKVFLTDHHITMMVGTSSQANRTDYLLGSIENFVSDDTQQLDNGKDNKKLNGSGFESSLQSYMSRLNYSFADKYLLTATIRKDGSSKFGGDNKWGWFPSASLAWRISKEYFFKIVPYVDDLKLRIGYGITGNQDIGNYGFAASLATEQYVFNNNYVSSVAPFAMPNANVKWESQYQYNVGFDLTMFKERINLSFDAYIKKTEDMLVRMEVPISTGYSSDNASYINAGEMENKGIEITLSTKNIKGEFEWNSDFNISVNRNTVKSINSDVPFYPSSGSFGLNYNIIRIVAGQKINKYYGYVTDGIFQNQKEVDDHAVQTAGVTSPGDIRFKDLNNDGIINDADRQYIGDPNPSMIYSLNNTFAYKNFELSIFFNGVYGNDILNANRIFTESMSVAYNQTKETLNRWTGEGTSNSMPRAVFNDPSNNSRLSERYVEDGSYLRLKTLALSYNIPKKILEKAKINNFKISLTGQNLYTWTNYSGFDPEVPNTGIDNNVYPITKVYSIGLNINF